RRLRLGRGPDLVLDQRDALAHELRLVARRQPEVQPDDGGEGGRGGQDAGGAALVLRRGAAHGAARPERHRRALELPPRHRRVDRQRHAAAAEGARHRPPARGVAGVPAGMKITRRQFVKGGVTAFTVTYAAPEFLSDLVRAQGAHVRNLVVLYMSGGNDSLSMLAPYNDPFYASRRPTLAIPAGQVLQIGTDASRVALGLRPRLTGLKQIFDQGRLTFIQRTGYETQSRSHFTGSVV